MYYDFKSKNSQTLAYSIKIICYANSMMYDTKHIYTTTSGNNIQTNQHGNL